MEFYIPLLIALGFVILYYVGVIHCSINVFDNLKDGQKVYSNLVPSKMYEEMKVRISNGGKKYAIDRNGVPQFRITLLDVAGMSVINEDEYENLMQ